MSQPLSYRDREFKRRLDEAKGHFGTATTQTQIPDKQRQVSIDAVREFLVSLEPKPCPHPNRQSSGSISSDGASSGSWSCADCGASDSWTSNRPVSVNP